MELIQGGIVVPNTADKKKTSEAARKAVEEARKAVGNINFHEGDLKAEKRMK